MKHLIVAFILLVVVLAGCSQNQSFEVSVYGLNWEDAEGMNERISFMEYNIYPFFMGRYVDTRFDLTNIFHFFGENIEMLSEQRQEENDFQVVMEFSNLSGDEQFLNGVEVSERATIVFYANDSLVIEALGLRGDAEMAHVRAQNPSEHPLRIPLDEIEWDRITDDYKASVESILIRGPKNWVSLRSQEDDFLEIIEYLAENSQDFQTRSEGPGVGFGVSMFFFTPEGGIEGERFSYLMARFYLNQEQVEELKDVFGRENWDFAAERFDREMEVVLGGDDTSDLNSSRESAQRLWLEDLDWGFLVDNHEDYLDAIFVISDWDETEISDLDYSLEILLLWLGENQNFLYDEAHVEGMYLLHFVFYEGEGLSGNEAWLYLDPSVEEDFWQSVAESWVENWLNSEASEE